MNGKPTETANERLIRVRKALKKTPTNFAGDLHLSRSYIYELEKERRVLNDRMVKLVSITFGVSEEWLKTGIGTMFDNSGGEIRKKIELLFDKLCPEFQEYMLRHLDLLLEMQNKRK